MRGLALALLPACMLAGCGGQPAQKPAPTPQASATPVADPAARLAAAVKAAYPHGMAAPIAPEISSVSHKLIDTSFGPVLISAGSFADGGAVAVHYLEARGASFGVRKSWPRVVVIGAEGAIGDWSISDAFTDQPVIHAGYGGTWQGHTCGYTSLIELRPDGPASIADFQTEYDYADGTGDENQSIQGKITDIRKGQGFTVKFEGTRSFAERYFWRNGKYQREGGESRVPTC